MASNNETQSRSERSEQPQNESHEEIRNSFSTQSIPTGVIRLQRHANRRQRDTIRRQRILNHLRREAYIHQFRSTNQLSNIDGLVRREDHPMEFESQNSPDFALNLSNYEDEARYEAILEALIANEVDETSEIPTAKSVVAALKIKKVECENELFCVICQDWVNIGETIKELPCVHNYHIDCIQSWLATKNTCPVCRFELPTSDLDHEKGEE